MIDLGFCSPESLFPNRIPLVEGLLLVERLPLVLQYKMLGVPVFRDMKSRPSSSFNY